MMKKWMSCLLAAVLLILPMGALADYNDHTDYVDWPLVPEGEEMTVRVATVRSEQYGKDPEDQWFWIWSEETSGIDFDVDQVLTTAVEERKSLMFASAGSAVWHFADDLRTGALWYERGAAARPHAVHHPGNHAQPLRMD